MREFEDDEAIGPAPRFKPIVGDNLHFYSERLGDQVTATGAGPYAATVIAVEPGSDVVALKVFALGRAPYDVEGVPSLFNRGELPYGWTELPL